MIKKIEQSFESITPDDWRKCVNHVKKMEDNHRQQDHYWMTWSLL